jgi:signal transduction histidine kinase
VLVLLVVGAIVFGLLQIRQSQSIYEGLHTHSGLIEDGMVFDGDRRLAGTRLAPDVSDSYDGLPKDLAFQVLDTSGTELIASPAGPALDALRKMPVRGSVGKAEIQAGPVSLTVYGRRVEKIQGTYLIRVARSGRLAAVVREIGSAIFLGASILATVLSLLAFSWFVLRTARQLVGPLQDISNAASTIGAANISGRLRSVGLPTELKPLIVSFNDALDRLETGYRVQQEFLASAAHELKTPLSLIRLEVEQLDLRMRERLLKDVDLMARQIHQLLHLAEASEAHNYLLEAVDMGEAAADALHFSDRLAERQGVALDLRCDGKAPVITADRGAVFVLLKNLLENAVQHSARGQVVTVQLHAHGLAIVDQGKGVRTCEQPKLFDRFWRGAHARHAGAGLGLAICKQIADAHRWNLYYVANETRAGAEFRIEFSPP